MNTIVPRTVDDYTLVFGLISGLVFFGLISVASGLVMGDSIILDEALSGTVLDPSECVDRRGEVWVETWVEGDDLLIRTNNIPESASSAILVWVWNETVISSQDIGESNAEIHWLIGGLGDLDSELEKKTSLMESIMFESRYSTLKQIQKTGRIYPKSQCLRSWKTSLS